MRFGVWHYLSGYVIIDIKGKNLERFLNRVVQSGGDIWRVRRTGSESVRACVSVATFYALRPIVRQCGVRVCIAAKRGAVISLSRFRFRKALLYGWMVVLALIIAASRYVWIVDVSGCDKVNADKLIASLKDMGVGIGTHKRAVATYALGQRLMATDERIAWAGVSISGVVLKIEISEAGETKPDPSQPTGPVSLYAAKGGIITELKVIDGKAKVNVGEAVVKGQELVSGILRNDELGFITTAARGAVSANVAYIVSAKVGPTIEKLSFSGTEAYYNAIKLFGFCIADEPEYATYTDEAVCEYELTGCLLPLKAEHRLRKETIMKQSPASRQELEQAAAAKAQDKLNELIPHSATIISKHTEYKTDADGAVTAIIRVMTEENIAEARGIYGQQ